MQNDHTIMAPPRMDTLDILRATLPEIARLAGPRLVAANENEDGQRLAESIIKRLVGGGAVTTHELHGGVNEHA